MAKLDGEYLLKDILAIMANGNPGALSFLIELINTMDEDRFIRYIEFFNNNDIYGSKLYMFWNDSCDKDLELVDKTIDMLEYNSIDKEIIHENLNRGRALPFREFLEGMGDRFSLKNIDWRNLK